MCSKLPGVIGAPFYGLFGDSGFWIFCLCFVLNDLR